MSITTEIQGDIAVISMDDGKANAMSLDNLNALDAALDAAEPAKAIVIVGRDGVFSGGFDLKTMQNNPDAAPAMIERGGEVSLRLFTHPKPIVLAVTGHALALGAVFCLCADTRIGRAGDFKLGLNETAISMVLPAFGVEPAKVRIPDHMQTRAIIQAELFDPESAVAAGFLDMVVEDPLPAAIAAAEKLAELPGATYAGQKMLVRGEVAERIKAAGPAKLG